MLVNSLELVHIICSMLEPELWFPGRASLPKRFQAKWNKQQSGRPQTCSYCWIPALTPSVFLCCLPPAILRALESVLEREDLR